MRTGPRRWPGAYFAELPLVQITPNPRQPRQVFDEEAMAELVHSIKEVGLLQPVVVRRTGEAAYELIMGERRWRATQEAGLETIPAIVRETDDDDMLRDALLENLHRSQLNPLEEAAAYRQLLDDFGCTHDELAGRIGRSRAADQQHAAAAQPLSRRPASGGSRACSAPATPGPCSGVEDLGPGPARRAGRLRGHLACAASRSSWPSAAREDADEPRVRRRASPRPPGLNELDDRLSDRLDTRVKVDAGAQQGQDHRSSSPP